MPRCVNTAPLLSWRPHDCMLVQVFGSSKAGIPLTAEDLGVAGALTVLMKDAIMPYVIVQLCVLVAKDAMIAVCVVLLQHADANA
jgi:hypothetical protein